MLIELPENPACIECGLCREVCPVFTITRDEAVAPRGRAILAAVAADGGTDSRPTISARLCRACRIACPSAATRKASCCALAWSRPASRPTPTAR